MNREPDDGWRPQYRRALQAIRESARALALARINVKRDDGVRRHDECGAMNAENCC